MREIADKKESGAQNAEKKVAAPRLKSGRLAKTTVGFRAETAEEIKDLLKLAGHTLVDMKTEFLQHNKEFTEQIHEVEYTIYVLTDALNKLEKMDLKAPWLRRMVAKERITQHSKMSTSKKRGCENAHGN